MDALSEILNVVSFRQARCFSAGLSAPWRLAAPLAGSLAGTLPPGAGALLYYFVAEGACTAHVPGAPALDARAGDVILLRHGGAHVLASGAGGAAARTLDLGAVVRDRKGAVTFGGGGAATRVICGLLAYDPRLLGPVLDVLPPVIGVSLREQGEPHWLERSLEAALQEMAGPRPGGTSLLSKLSEVVVVEALRRYIPQCAGEGQGWLGGLRDATVGRCLGLMHAQPAHAWTVDGLARAVGASRSVLAERFLHLVGQPPMQYLGKLRMALAANYLSTTSLSLVRVAAEVGYETDAAFSRAFRREYGVPPATWRRGTGPRRAVGACARA